MTLLSCAAPLIPVGDDLVRAFVTAVFVISLLMLAEHRSRG